jgi:hypothetical protein
LNLLFIYIFLILEFYYSSIHDSAFSIEQVNPEKQVNTYPSTIGRSSIQFTPPRRLPAQFSLLLLNVPAYLDNYYLLAEIQQQFRSVKYLSYKSSNIMLKQLPHNFICIIKKQHLFPQLMKSDRSHSYV